MENNIYLDHNATTPLEPEVAETMRPYIMENESFGNAGRPHWAGLGAKQAIKHARMLTSHLINAQPHEIIFTSGASESVNHAIKGVIFAYRNHSAKKHIVSSCIEHPCVSASCQFASDYLDIQISEIPVDQYGVMDSLSSKQLVRRDTALLSLIYASQEIGTIQPIREIIEHAHSLGVLVHIDATSAVGKIPVDVQQLDCDLLSFSGHKIYGPKGIGGLYIRESLHQGLPVEGGISPTLVPLIHGAAPATAFRSGTPNTACIAGFGKACELTDSWLTKSNIESLQNLTDYFWQSLHRRYGDRVALNGHPEPSRRVCNTLNVSFRNQNGEALLARMANIAASSGTATASILEQLGRSPEAAREGIRFSLGRSTRREHIDRTLEYIELALGEN